MKYLIQETLKGKIFIRGGEMETLEIVKDFIERQIPLNITYINDVDISKEN